MWWACMDFQLDQTHTDHLVFKHSAIDRDGLYALTRLFTTASFSCFLLQQCLLPLKPHWPQTIAHRAYLGSLRFAYECRRPVCSTAICFSVNRVAHSVALPSTDRVEFIPAGDPVVYPALDASPRLAAPISTDRSVSLSRIDACAPPPSQTAISSDDRS
jgi:hypothetical protein